MSMMVLFRLPQVIASTAFHHNRKVTEEGYILF
jgi:hypothetical protein